MEGGKYWAYGRACPNDLAISVGMVCACYAEANLQTPLALPSSHLTPLHLAYRAIWCGVGIFFFFLAVPSLEYTP